MSRTLRTAIAHGLLVAASIGVAVSLAPHSARAAVTEAPAARTAPGMPKFGDKGPRVAVLQKAIIKNGFTLRGGANGVFDKRTLTVLKTFQRIVGLKVTGVVDADTAKVLKLSTTAPATTSTSSTTTSPTRTFPFTMDTLPKRGHRGDAVLIVQNALAAAGIPVQGGIDGMFGKGTTASIGAFQTMKGIALTGLLDRTTAVALALVAPTTQSVASTATTTNKHTARLTIGTLPTRGQKGANVTLLQKRLVKAGISIKGGVDGVFGAATAVAIKKYQSAKGLNPTGKLDLRTAASLSLVAEQASPISVFPVQGNCGYENTWHAPRPGGRLHVGVDILAKEGNLLYAVADGTITKIYVDGRDVRSGNGVRLTMADGTYFFYGHMHHVAEGIKLGTKVKAGQVLGYLGKTGATTTPHLHFEYHPQGGDAIDPTPYVAAVDACDVTEPLSTPKD